MNTFRVIWLAIPLTTMMGCQTTSPRGGHVGGALGTSMQDEEVQRARAVVKDSAEAYEALSMALWRYSKGLKDKGEIAEDCNAMNHGGPFFKAAAAAEEYSHAVDRSIRGAREMAKNDRVMLWMSRAKRLGLMEVDTRQARELTKHVENGLEWIPDDSMICVSVPLAFEKYRSALMEETEIWETRTEATNAATDAAHDAGLM